MIARSDKVKWVERHQPFRLLHRWRKL